MSGGRRRAAQVVALLVLSVSLLAGAGTASGPHHQGPSALFFGDSLIGGTGAVPRRPVEPRTVADLMGWDPVVDSFGGTGYTTGGPHGRPYLERFRKDHYLSRTYDVVIIEGGTNDAWFGSLTTLHDAARRALLYVRSRQPRARIVMVGGYVPSGVDRTRYEQVDLILRGVAAELDLQYVSQLHYGEVTDKGFLSKDRYHPSDLGYGRMGRDLATALKAG